MLIPSEMYQLKLSAVIIHTAQDKESVDSPVK